MILEGKIIEVVSSQDGISKSGKEWKKITYLLETNEKYPKKVVFDVFGEERIGKIRLVPNENVRLGVDAESREWNGKWFTNLSAYGRVDEDGKLEQSNNQPAHEPAQQLESIPDGATATVESGDNNTELPF